MVRLSIQSVSKSFGKKKVLSEVSMDVEEGEFSAILGPSGSGKTTLLRCIAGLERPDSGKIIFDGEDFTQVSPRMRNVSLVFQNYALFPLMSVFENIAFPLRVRKVADSKLREQVRRMAELLKIDQHLDHLPKELSGGEQQRVAVARALVREPKLFLMDEPLSNLDAPLRAELRTELKKLHREIGITTVYVTHDQLEAMSLADMMGVMDAGRLLQYDKPDVVYDRPSNLFVAHFVGAYPSNLVDVSYLEQGSVSFLHAKGFDFPLSPEADMMTILDNGAKPLVLSFRPEDVSCSTTKAQETPIQGKVELIEQLGPAILLEINAQGDRISALASSDRIVKGGDDVWLGLRNSRYHVYDKATGNLLI